MADTLESKIKLAKPMRTTEWLAGVSGALSELANEMSATGYAESAWLIRVAALSVHEAALAQRRSSPSGASPGSDRMSFSFA